MNIKKSFAVKNGKNQQHGIKRIILFICALYGLQASAQPDSMASKKLRPIISMEIEAFSIGYGGPKYSSKRSLGYRSSSIFYYYQPLYKNFGIVPIAGYYLYYWNDKYVTQDKYISNGFYYGLGLEKRFKINESSNYAIGVQRIYYENESKSYMPVGAPVSKYQYSSNVWRLRLTGNTQLYKRLGLTCSLNFVAYPKSEKFRVAYIGEYRNINFSFGFTYNFKNKQQ